MKIHEIQQEPFIKVGVMSAKEHYFSLLTNCSLNESLYLPAGDYHITLEKHLLQLCHSSAESADISEELIFEGETCSIVAQPVTQKEPDFPEANFCLHAVRIGVDFHWDRLQRQYFPGELHFIIDREEDKIVAINHLKLESYLACVIASEMNAHAHLELLCAHAIISRSWLLAQALGQRETAASSCGYDNEEEHIRWYERDAHQLFDVCADDHCQRYQGCSKACTPQLAKAMSITRGIVLAHEEEICDARFYKCCGGLSEHFESCWSDSPKAYLKSIYDHAPTRAKAQDLRNEAQARAFILSSPPAFCNTRNQEVLQQVLNDYDQETADFYRWNVHYDVDELSAIVRERSGIDFGRIQALIPVQRGASARLVKLKIVGEKRSLIVGKELEIRKFLSRTHLYSSAFVVDECRDPKGNLTGFNLQGAGWGHGVGLCQIGAAMMSEQGYQHKEILQHYYPQAQLLQLY